MLYFWKDVCTYQVLSKSLGVVFIFTPFSKGQKGGSFSYLYFCSVGMSMRIGNGKFYQPVKERVSQRAKSLPYTQMFKRQITYPHIAKPHNIFDKPSYFRGHLKTVNLKLTYIHTYTHTHTKKNLTYIQVVCGKYKRKGIINKSLNFNHL